MGRLSADWQKRTQEDQQRTLIRFPFDDR